MEVLDQHIDECDGEESGQEEVGYRLEGMTLVVYGEFVRLRDQHHEKEAQEDTCAQCDEEVGLPIVHLLDLRQVCTSCGDHAQNEHVAQQYDQFIHTTASYKILLKHYHQVINIWISE